MSAFERFLESFFNPKLMLRYWPDIAQGMLVTVEIALAVLASGLALGLGLALARSYRIAPVSAAIVVFVDVFRALPPLVLILIIYFGLPSVGVNLPPSRSCGSCSHWCSRHSPRRRSGPASCRFAAANGMPPAPPG